MTPDTLKYLEGVLTEKILGNVEGFDEFGSYGNALGTERFAELSKASKALKEVNRSIRRAENRAARKQDRS